MIGDRLIWGKVGCDAIGDGLLRISWMEHDWRRVIEVKLDGTRLETGY